jgi:hypothetical protein
MKAAPVKVDDLRLAGQDEEDLRWYFCEADGEIGGLKSGFGGFLRIMEEGLPVEGGDVRSNGAEDWQVDLVAQARKVRRALAHAGPRYARVLWHEYGPPQPPNSVEMFGRLGPLAVELPAVVAMHDSHRTRQELADWIRDSAIRVLSDKAKDVDMVLASEIHRGLEALLVEAHGAYEQGLRATRRRRAA